MYYLYMIFIYWISMVILMEYTSDIPSMEDHPTVHFLWLKLLYLRGHWCWKTIGINRCLDKNVTAISHLVGGLEPWNFMTFHSVGNVIIPTDELIFFRGVKTTNQSCCSRSAQGIKKIIERHRSPVDPWGMQAVVQLWLQLWNSKPHNVGIWGP